MLKDTIYIYQFKDPLESEPSNFNWSLNPKEVEETQKLLDEYAPIWKQLDSEKPITEEQLFNDILIKERDENSKD